MKAVVLEKIGGVENLIFKDVPNPTPNENEVVVKIFASALNHRDVWIRLGKYMGIKVPIILGSDGAGVVYEVGKNVDKNLIGKEVLIDPASNWGDDEKVQSENYKILGLPDDGTNAELVKVSAKNIFPKPNYLNFEEAAALALCATTAYRAVKTRANIKSNENILITGIGGGVAIAALQIAVATNANVFVTSSSENKIQKVKSLGAIGGALYTNEKWKEELFNLTNKKGFDVVIDGAGGKMFDDAIEILKPSGRYVIYGATLGVAKEIQVRRIFWKQISIFGTTMGSPKEFVEAINFFEKNKIKPVIDSVYDLSQTQLAHKKMEEGLQFGKIVLKVG